jgi:hypothetical protein
MEPAMEKLSDDELKAKTGEFRARLEKGESLESLIPEAIPLMMLTALRIRRSVRSLRLPNTLVNILISIIKSQTPRGAESKLLTQDSKPPVVIRQAAYIPSSYSAFRVSAWISQVRTVITATEHFS